MTGHVLLVRRAIERERISARIAIAQPGPQLDNMKFFVRITFALAF